MKKRILITGGAGFVGSHLAEKILGYRPKMDFDRGIAELANWTMKQNATCDSQQAAGELDERGLTT